MKIFSHQVLLKPTKKLWLCGLALAFQNPKLRQSHYEAVFMARLTASGQARHSTNVVVLMLTC